MNIDKQKLNRNNPTYFTDLIRTIWTSKKRFLSLIIMTMLGAIVFIGLVSTAPNMRKNLELSIKGSNRDHIQIASYFGMDDEDRHILENFEGIKHIDYYYQSDLYINDSDIVVRANSLPKNSSLPLLKKGRLPEKNDEILMDEAAEGKGYKIGQEIILKSAENYKLVKKDQAIIKKSANFKIEKPVLKDPTPKEDLKLKKFKIVGFADHIHYLSIKDRGSSQLGDGKVNFFAFVFSEVFEKEKPDGALLTFKNLEKFNTYDEAYKKAELALIDKLEEALKDRPVEVEKQIKKDLTNSIEEGKKSIDKGFSDLEKARTDLATAKKEIEKAWKDYRAGKIDYRNSIRKGKEKIDSSENSLRKAYSILKQGQKEYENGFSEYSKGLNELNTKKIELNSALTKINDGEKKLNNAKKALKAKGITRSNLLSNRSKLNEAIVQIDKGLEQLNKAIKDSQANLDLINSESSKLEAAKKELLTKKKTSQDAMIKIKAGQDEIKSILSHIDNLPKEKVDELKKKLADLERQEKEINQGLKVIDENISQIDQALKYMSESKSKIEALPLKKKALESKKSQIRQGLNKVSQGLATLDKIFQEEKKLEEGKNKYNDGLTKFKEGEKKLKDSKRELDQAKANLASGLKNYKAGKKSLDEAKKEFNKGKADGIKELSNAKKDLNSGERKYLEGLKEYEEKSPEAKSELSNAKKDLEKANKKLENIKVPEYSIKGRYGDIMLSSYLDGADNMDALTLIFPVIFYLIAMLITMTTSSRMVEEERIQIGTMKALGYDKKTISRKYLIYSGLAATIGTGLGIFLGYKFLMPIIVRAYSFGIELLYPLEFSVSFSHIIIALIIGLGLTISTVIFSINHTLKEKAANLMKAKPPKKGNRIFLERIKPLWKRIGFMGKITMRNITVKKSRMFMTILGVMGCSSLIIMGFGLKSSISNMLYKQFHILDNYDVSIVYDNEADINDLDELKKIINTKKPILAPYYAQSASFKNKDGIQETVSIMVPFDEEAFDKLRIIRDRKSKEFLSLPQMGAIASERLFMSLNNGDKKLELKDHVGHKYQLHITEKAENYIGNILFMTPKNYKNFFGEEIRENAILAKFQNINDWHEIQDKVRDNPATLRTVEMSDTLDSVNKLMESLDIVVLVIILISSALAFVVLFNLTNLNVSERQRELSTIKVLGFTNREVTEYIYRESLILSLVGIVFGLLGGKAIHYMISMVLSPEGVLIDPHLVLSAFLIGSGITMSFSIIVMIIIHFQLKKVDMVEALKADE